MAKKAAGSAKSCNSAVGSCLANSASVKWPVATAIDFAPIALAQAMSCGVSPTMKTSSGAKSRAWRSLAEGEGSQLVADVAVVGEGAELEVSPDLVVVELDLGPAPEVPGEEALGQVGAVADLLEDVEDAGMGLAVGERHLGLEVGQVEFHELVERPLAERQLVVAENLARDEGVGPAPVVDALQGGGLAGDGLDGADEGLFPRLAGADQGAVDVPKDQLHDRANVPPGPGKVTNFCAARDLLPDPIGFRHRNVT